MSVEFPRKITVTDDEFLALFKPRHRLTAGLRTFLWLALVAFVAGNSVPLLTGQPPTWWIVPSSFCAVIAAQLLRDDHKSRTVTVPELEDIL